MKTKKIFSLIAALLAMLMVLSACGAASSTPSTTQAASQSTDTQPAATTEKAADPVTITYCNFNSSGGNEETLAKMVEAFEAAHTDIKVEVETIGYDDYFTQMQTRVAGGTAPDCYELNIENFAAYANKGLLAEISGVDVSGLNDTALNAFCVNGKQYGLPESFSNVVLIYNKDLFDQAGWPIPPMIGRRTTCRPPQKQSVPWAMTFTASGSPLLITSSSRSLPSTAALC